jgi:hypothetical protein
MDTFLTKVVLVTQSVGECGDIKLLNCVGYDKMICHERYLFLQMGHVMAKAVIRWLLNTDT